MKLYQKIARVVSQKNEPLKGKELKKLQDLLPSGSGIDYGSVILLKSTDKRIEIITSFHHLNEVGFYTQWTDHRIIITPSFEEEITIRITGKNYNSIKDYLYDVFYEALLSEV